MALEIITLKKEQQAEILKYSDLENKSAEEKAYFIENTDTVGSMDEIRELYKTNFTEMVDYYLNNTKSVMPKDLMELALASIDDIFYNNKELYIGFKIYIDK